MLITVMPRSGGDYVFQSRILRVPLVTYIAMGIWLIGNAWFLPYIWSAIAGTGFAPFLAMVGIQTGSQYLINVAAWITTPQAIFLFGFFVVFWMWLVNAFGLRAYGTVQKYFLFGAMIFSIIYYAWIFATPHQAFVDSFNSIAPKLGGPTNAYQGIINLAAQNGFSPNYSFNLGQSVALIASWSAVFVVGYYTALGGEIRKAGTLSSQMWISVGGCVFVGIMNTLLIVGIENLVGHQFNASAGFLFFNGKWPLSVPPYAGLFTMALGGLILPIIALLYFNSWTWMNYPNILPYNSRVTMAMSFDRMLPERMAAINDKYHIPLFNINVWSIVSLGLVLLAFLVPTSSQLFLINSLCLSLVIMLSCAAGAFMPFSKTVRQSYSSSAVAKYKLGGVPLVTVLGIIAVLVELYIDYLLLTNPLLGVAGGNLVLSVGFLVILAVVFGATYYAFKYWNKRRGIDVSVAFNQIPPE
jgi:amino acid transporter